MECSNPDDDEQSLLQLGFCFSNNSLWTLDRNSDEFDNHSSLSSNNRQDSKKAEFDTLYSNAAKAKPLL